MHSIQLIAVILSVLANSPEGPVYPSEGDRPPFDTIEDVVRAEFEGRKDFSEGDLIVQGDVEPLYDKLAEAGWTVSDWNELVGRVPAQGELMVKELMTKEGKRLMRKVSSMPNGYDRLDRMSKLPNGRRLLRDVIQGKGGYKLIEYMTESEGGKNLGRSLQKAPGGKDFNKPTGRVYTLESFLAELRLRHEAWAGSEGEADGPSSKRSATR
jgi:hypothetical protein